MSPFHTSPIHLPTRRVAVFSMLLHQSFRLHLNRLFVTPNIRAHTTQHITHPCSQSQTTFVTVCECINGRLNGLTCGSLELYVLQIWVINKILEEYFISCCFYRRKRSREKNGFFYICCHRERERVREWVLCEWLRASCIRSHLLETNEQFNIVFFSTHSFGILYCCCYFWCRSCCGDDYHWNIYEYIYVTISPCVWLL